MSQHRPAIDNILATVRRFLETCAPKLEGETRYHAQVCAYLLAMAEREWHLAPGFDANERDQLAVLLGHDAPPQQLNAELAAGLRAGRFDMQMPQVLATLLTLAAEKVAVVKPDHLAPRHRPTPSAGEGSR